MSLVTLSKTIPSSIQAPVANSFSLFFDTDGRLKFKDSLNVVRVVGNDSAVDLSGKLDKATNVTVSTQVYAKNPNGTQTMVDISQITGNYSKDRTDVFPLQASNIDNGVVTVALSFEVLTNRRYDAFLNGVLISDSLITISDKKIVTLSLDALNVSPQVGDNLTIKYMSQA